ncbi:heterokaryon incompatibility protein-domain-containing protein [Exophiala viscosa]|uniref:heterokaryon incompatibility protein-domain-containing protein n=1 Tax=Exophiala viscosa TaxID=2486360 RepID=UPI00219BC14E|nr:heterokaryon incompatibility protein-domain-containing protein [Exophiala viscosa]
MSMTETSDRSRPLWTPGNRVSFASRMRRLKELLHECWDSHEDCNPGSTVLPTRLVEITAEGQDGFYLRLVDTDLLDSTKIRYSALSHCWGSASSGPSKTTQANLYLYRRRIPYSDLTQTIKDAVRVTSALDMRYLWVDSLCIIQGDAKDWETEATRMAGVFGGSDLTIVANASSDAHGGLFLDSVAPAVVVRGQADANVSDSWLLRWHPADLDVLKASVLRTRGWVFQELWLPRKKVFFEMDQFVWDCRHRLAAEDDSHHSPEGQRASPTDPNPSMAWQRVVGAYSQKNFSYRSDRLAALAGLTQWWSLECKQASFLGIWKETLARDLAWALTPEDGPGKDTIPPSKSAIPGVPSWSWFSWDCGVSFWSPKAGESTGLDLQLLDCDVRWRGEAMTSDILMTRLRVRGLLKSLELVHEVSEDESARLSVENYTTVECHITVDEFGSYILTHEDASRIETADCLLLSCSVGEKTAMSFMLVKRLAIVEGFQVCQRYGLELV